MPRKPLPLRGGLIERLVDPGALFFLAAKQRNALAVLADTSENVTILRLRLVLVFGNADKAADNQSRYRRSVA